jgi:hypothetical protein
MAQLEAMHEKGMTAQEMDNIKGADEAIASAFRKLLKVNDAETQKESEPCGKSPTPPSKSSWRWMC